MSIPLVQRGWDLAKSKKDQLNGSNARDKNLKDHFQQVGPRPATFSTGKPSSQNLQGDVPCNLVMGDKQVTVRSSHTSDALAHHCTAAPFFANIDESFISLLIWGSSINIA